MRARGFRTLALGLAPSLRSARPAPRRRARPTRRSLAAVLSVSPFAFPGDGRAMADQAGKSAAASPVAAAGVTLAEINDHPRFPLVSGPGQ